MKGHCLITKVWWYMKLIQERIHFLNWADFFFKRNHNVLKEWKRKPFLTSECYRKHFPSMALSRIRYVYSVKAFSLFVLFQNTYVKWSLPSAKAFLSATMVSEGQVSQKDKPQPEKLPHTRREWGLWGAALEEEYFLSRVLLRNAPWIVIKQQTNF